MIKLLPLLLIALSAIAVFRFSAWRMGHSLRRQSRILKNDQIERHLDRLAETAGIDRIEVRLLRSPIVNGLATPGGEIYITEGLFRHYQSGRITGDEITSVIAHELGHLALGHTRRRMIDLAGAQTARVLLGGILARFIPVIGWYIANFLIGLFVARISRGDEFEADAYATALMLRSGHPPESQARMLEKLEDLVPAGNLGQQVSWLASHPPVPERAAVIRANAARWQGRGGLPAGQDAGSENGAGT